jgi:hypothetical protein
MNKLSSISALLLLTLLSSSCNPFKPGKKGIPDDFDYGKIVNNKYTNTFFDMEMDIPKGWAVQTSEQTESIARKGREIITRDNKKLKEALKTADVGTANLLAVFKYEIGSPVEEYNMNFVMVAVNLKDVPGIRTGREYLFEIKKVLKQQNQIEYQQMDTDFKKMMIGKQDFYVMNTTMFAMGNTIKQRYHATVKNGFAFSIIITYQDDEQRPELEKVINSVKFREGGKQ